MGQRLLAVQLLSAVHGLRGHRAAQFDGKHRDASVGTELGFDGAFYGTTEYGGSKGKGSIFQYANGKPNPIYEFQDTGDGAYPWAPPLYAWDGNLYGVTASPSGDSRTPAPVYRIPPTAAASGQIPVIGTAPSATTAPLILGDDGNMHGPHNRAGARG